MFAGDILQNAMGGGRHESYLEDCLEEITSKDIVSFSYIGTDFSVSAKRENGIVKISCNGGGKYNRRDGSLYGICYETEDDSIFQSLQEVIDKNHEIRGNGHCVYVDGLPGGIGDILDVIYASGEKLYKTSNQCMTVSFESAKEFNDVFHQFVMKDGYEYSTAGSNVKLFDDADEEFVQGTWMGTHFGDEIVVTFEGNLVTISVDGKVVDDHVPYVIFQGSIKKNQLKEGKEKAESPYDYEDFEGVSILSKHNWFTMDAYFYRDGSSSSCNLHNFNKEKPAEEE